MSLPANLNPMPAWLEDAWLERYLNRETTEAETAWFEAYLLEHPGVAEALESDTAIAAALRSVRPGEVAVKVAVRRPTTAAVPGSTRRSRPWLSAALAAGLAVLACTPWMLRSVVPEDGLQPNRVRLDQLRSETQAFTIQDQTGAAWTLLEIPTRSPRARYQVWVGNEDMGSFRTDNDGLLSVLLNRTPDQLKASNIRTVSVGTSREAETTELTLATDLDTAVRTSRVCRAGRQLTASSNPLDFATVGGRWKNYIDITHAEPDRTPGNSCASNRIGWTNADNIHICTTGSGKTLRLFAHLFTGELPLALNCSSGSPVTLDGQNGLYRSAYWDDYIRGFRYFIFLEWDESRCPVEGCKPYFIESFDLDTLATNACFVHQATVDQPSESACAAVSARKQADTGDGYRPP